MWSTVQSSLRTLTTPVVKLSQTLGPPSSVSHLWQQKKADTQRRPYGQCNIYGLLWVLSWPSTICHSKYDPKYALLFLSGPMSRTKTCLGCAGLKAARINIERSWEEVLHFLFLMARFPVTLLGSKILCWQSLTCAYEKISGDLQ